MRQTGIPLFRPLLSRPLGAFATTVVGVLLLAAPALAYPPTGLDVFDSMAAVRVSSVQLGLPETSVVLVGPTHIWRGDPYDPGDGRLEIDTRIESMVLFGQSPLGSVLIKAIPPCPGKIKQKVAGVDFPADSFFRVRVEVQIPTPAGTIRLFSDPAKPILLMATIDAIPPFGAQYMPEGTFVGVDLLDESGTVVGFISHVGHFVGQHPTFSVAPGGPSGLNPADLLGRPTAPKIRAAALGLTSGDDVDGLSYGFEFLFLPLMDLRFSVDRNSRGRAGSAVRREADKSPPEAHGDEFRVTPFAQSGGGSNVQVLDENGDTAPPFPLQIGDELDALAEEPPDFADGNGDGIPERAVYFSLAAGSPSLATLGASPADLLVTTAGAPGVFIPAADMGLTPQDDIDAFCLDARNKVVLFSLAPGSPSLGNRSAADTFYVVAPRTSFSPWATAANLGLDPADNVDAMKCKSGEIDEFAQSRLEFTLIQTGGGTESVTASCRSGWTAGTLDGGTGRGQFSEVPVYMSSLYCTAPTSQGMANIRLRSPSKFPNKFSEGGIQDATDDGMLGIRPWAEGGAEMSMDLYLEMDIGTGLAGLHHPDPIRLLGSISSKPPRAGEMLFRIPGPGGSTVTPLFLEGGTSTGLSIGDVRYVPDARPVPSFTSASLVEAGGYAGRPSPGGLAALFGTFNTGLEVAPSIPLPRVLGDAVQVRFRVESAGAAAPAAASGGNQQGAIVELPAPLMFVSGGQINLQVPWEVDPGAGNVTAIVSVNGVDSNAIPLPVGPASPGIFSFDFGPGRGVAFNNVDGTVAQPVGSVPGVTCRPTVSGEALVILASGLGPTNPPGITGQNSFDAAGNFVQRDTLALPRVLIGGVEAELLFSGLSPEFVGVVQINVTVPAGVTPGNAVPLILEVNGQRTREDVTIAVGAN